MALCSIVGNQVTISDIFAEEQKPGLVLPVAAGESVLTSEQTIAVLATIAKDVNQAPDEVSEKGVGTYGLSKENLESTGVIKPGIGLSNDPLDLPVILDDPSVFTGNHGVTALIDLFLDEPLQRELTQTATNNAMIELSQLGAINPVQSPEEIAEVAALSTQFNVDEIASMKLDPDSLDPALLLSMLSMGILAVNAIKALAQKLSKKPKTPAASTGTVKTPDIDKEVDKLIGSKRIPSEADK